MARGEYCVYADVDLREERRVARQERELNLIEPDDEWIDTASVGRLLGRSTARSHATPNGQYVCAMHAREIAIVFGETCKLLAPEDDTAHSPVANEQVTK